MLHRAAKSRSLYLLSIIFADVVSFRHEPRTLTGHSSRREFRSVVVGVVDLWMQALMRLADYLSPGARSCRGGTP
jgi:hypothetical protein